jgi:hypothetical protein
MDIKVIKRVDRLTFRQVRDEIYIKAGRGFGIKFGDIHDYKFGSSDHEIFSLILSPVTQSLKIEFNG